MSGPISELRRLVERALELPEADREAFLAEACGGDDDLLAEAKELLAATADDSGFLQPPSRPDRSRPVLPAGASIGAYRLLRVVASGGMGTVYEAEREEPRRRVALKVMRAGLGSAASVARFRYEVEVLANLRHPGVAHMYESGVHLAEIGPVRHELPWFAMEFVDDARPITRFAREEGLSLPERLELFAQVCDAVQHGHGRGVIHRDLKPDNVLVGQQGRPKVIDFGVARALESGSERRTVLTSQGEIVGTLAYMSPEQVSALPDAVDARSDVYSLGILLYELATDALPYDLSGRPIIESARIITEDTPRRPSSVSPRASGDIEAVILKCLEKDPERRYSSAATLGDDVRRVLRFEPVQARPPSVSYRLSMFVRRHRILVASGTLIALVLIASTVVSLGFLAAARRSERLARNREQQAKSERDRSRALFEKLFDRSVAAAFELAPTLRDLPGGVLISSEVIAGAIADLEALEADAGADHEVRLRIGFAYIRFGDVRGNPAYPNVGDRQGATTCYQRALEIAEGLVAGGELEPESERLLGVSERKLGQLGMLEGHMEEAERRTRKALALFERLVAEHPDDLGLLAEVGTTHDKLGGIASRLGDRKAVRRHIERYAEIFREVARRRPDDRRARQQVVLARQQFAGVLYAEQKYEAACTEWKSTLPLLDELAAEEPGVTQHPRTIAWVKMWLGTANDRLGHPDEASRWLEDALGDYRELVRNDPQNDQYPPAIGNILWILGGVDEVREKNAEPGSSEAITALERAIGRYREAVALYDRLKTEGRLLARQAGAAEMIRRRIEECVSRLAALRAGSEDD